MQFISRAKLLRSCHVARAMVLVRGLELLQAGGVNAIASEAPLGIAGEDEEAQVDGGKGSSGHMRHLHSAGRREVQLPVRPRSIISGNVHTCIICSLAA